MCFLVPDPKKGWVWSVQFQQRHPSGHGQGIESCGSSSGVHSAGPHGFAFFLLGLIRPLGKGVMGLSWQWAPSIMTASTRASWLWTDEGEEGPLPPTTGSMGVMRPRSWLSHGSQSLVLGECSRGGLPLAALQAMLGFMAST